MSVSRRYRIADSEQIEPVEGKRYEIIDGEPYVTHAPSWRHQYPCSQINTALGNWSSETQLGTTLQVPGVTDLTAGALAIGPSDPRRGG